ncbi:MAG: S8 family peptidase [Archangiaceae bacterium]|nr:S8 family peptidase [Archangiaceae bacterium]
MFYIVNHALDAVPRAVLNRFYDSSRLATSCDKWGTMVTPVIFAVLVAISASGSEYPTWDEQLSLPRVPGEFVVHVGSGTDLSLAAQSLTSWLSRGVVKKLSPGARPFVVVSGISDADAVLISRHPLVEHITPNLIGRMSGVQTSSGGSFSLGLDRIDQRGPITAIQNYEYGTTGNGVHVFIVDDQIRLTHVDFGNLPWDPIARQVTNDFDATSGSGQNTDHGTQMASIVGGLRGGVAKGVRIHGVDVVETSGSPTISGLLSGLQFVELQTVRPSVVNLSLEFPVNASIDAEVQALINLGFTVVVSAGNGATDAANVSPARVSDAITVGALNQQFGSDTFLSTSNYGALVDLLAPAKSIVAADNFSDVSFNSHGDGTSQAAAHVTGIAARYLELRPTATPVAVSTAITQAATFGVVSGGLPPGTPNAIAFSDFVAPRNFPARAIRSGTERFDGALHTFFISSQKRIVTGYQRSGTRGPVPCLSAMQEASSKPAAGGGGGGNTTSSGSEAFAAFIDGSSIIWQTTLPSAHDCVGNPTDFSSAVMSAVDSVGDVYVAVNRTAGIKQQAFVYKISGSTHAVLWGLQIGSVSTRLAGVVLDGVGHVIVAGDTSDTMPGSTSFGGSDGFAISFSASGMPGASPLFTRKFGTAGNETLTSVANRDVTTVVLAGVTPSLMPSAKDISGVTMTAAFGGDDAFVVAIPTSGANSGIVTNTLQVGGSGNEGRIAVASNGIAVAISGSTTSALAAPRLGGGGLDAFVAKLDANLVGQWMPKIAQFGGASNESVSTVLLGGNNPDVFIVGSSTGSLTQGANPGGFDTFVVKYSKDGQWRWDWQSNAVGDDEARGAASNSQFGDGEAPLYIVGHTASNVWPKSPSLGDTDWFNIVLEGF